MLFVFGSRRAGTNRIMGSQVTIIVHGVTRSPDVKPQNHKKGTVTVPLSG